VDGSGTSARFNAPWGLAKDGTGNLYVADSSNNTIRKISTTQVVSTIAGAAAQTGNNDASGAGARFYSPNGLGVDGLGVLYVADYANHMIRKVTTAGAVTTFAGSGTGGYSDTAPVKFNFPTDVALDLSGNAYVADSSNHLIRKITSSGVVSTFAGTATVSGFSNTAPVTFSGPQGVGLDSTGTILYVAEVFNNAVRKITGGTVTTFAASGLNAPSRTAVDGAGNVYVADTGNHAIRAITPGGSMSTFAGLVGTSGSADGNGGAARFSSPRDIAIDGSGNLYVADTGNNAIRKITPAGDVTTLAGVAAKKGFVAGSPPGALSSPVGVAISGNALYVTMANGVVKIGPLQ
jgi:sugar lactone lactonase YvrE